MAITFFAEGVKLPAIKKRETGDWIKNVAGIYGKKCGDISYIFCSDEKILEINKEYLDHDYYTDIITFDYTEKNRISGSTPATGTAALLEFYFPDAARLYGSGCRKAHDASHAICHNRHLHLVYGRNAEACQSCKNKNKR